MSSRYLLNNLKDAHEFLMACLDHISLETVLGADFLAKQKDLVEYDPLINLQFKTKNTIQCKKCGYQSSHSEVYKDISLNLPSSTTIFENNISIEELFAKYFDEEIVEYNCSKCEHNSASLRHEIETQPKILLLHLKRFDKTSKRSDPIDVPLRFTMGIRASN